MDIVSLVIGSALFALVGVFVLRLFYVIARNLINGRKFHQSLEREFDRLRLSRMLGALGIDKTRYIHKLQVVDIKQQMESCSQCKNTDECDSKLDKGEIDIDAIDFCNNEESLKQIKENTL
ncbi:MAG TPA: hypothetical protein ENJ64_00935 [Thiotrichales bacterium]|nr:hypothetical protein [Thiotrichales bacterium]